MSATRTPYPFKGNQFWFYRRIEPEYFHFNEVLYELKADAAARRSLLDDPEAFFRHYELGEQEAEALRENKITKYVAAGGHPILAWTVVLLLRYDKGDRQAGH
jgi:hypothetical protein